jgi:hypothetical protein
VPLRPRTLSDSKPKNYYDDWEGALRDIPSGYKTTIIIPFNSLTGNYELTNFRIHDLTVSFFGSFCWDLKVEFWVRVCRPEWGFVESARLRLGFFGIWQIR